MRYSILLALLLLPGCNEDTSATKPSKAAEAVRIEKEVVRRVEAAKLESMVRTSELHTVRLIGLASTPDPSIGTRTNIGVVNLEPVPATVRIRLYDGAKGPTGYLGTFTVQLQPMEWRQLNDVLRQLTDRVVAEAYAIVHTEAGGGRFLAYASVIDNGTGDAVFIPAQ